ncbi:hypothetical protein F2Q70_00012025 [Brassica cretica]|uniref:Uncharacterized protein n=1 Tax=Brassica cretica TaxID=69181 RepID=A0A8S9M3T7_BRACR|nr:hypothetical protein F2Q70_00012025 [Brassica cretica]
MRSIEGYVRWNQLSCGLDGLVTKLRTTLCFARSGGVDIPWVLPLLDHELHRCDICLAMDGDLSTMRLRSFFDQFEVNKNPMSEALPVFLESGTCASREEAIEEMKESRSMVHPCVFHWEKKDEYGVYRDEHGYARAPDRRIIHVSREDIRDILARATMYEAACICLPEQVEKFNRILPNLRSYSRADIDDIVNSIYRSEKMSLDDTYMSLGDIYFPLNDIIEMLTTRMDELKTEMDMIQQ